MVDEIHLPPGDRVTHLDGDRGRTKRRILDEHIHIGRARLNKTEQRAEENKFLARMKVRFHEKAESISTTPRPRVQQVRTLPPFDTARTSTKPFRRMR
jgi:hypothetical protein